MIKFFGFRTVHSDQPAGGCAGVLLLTPLLLLCWSFLLVVGYTALFFIVLYAVLARSVLLRFCCLATTRGDMFLKMFKILITLLIQVDNNGKWFEFGLFKHVSDTTTSNSGCNY